MQHIYTQPSTPITLATAENSLIATQQCGEIPDFPKFDDLFLNGQISLAKTNSNTCCQPFDEELNYQKTNSLNLLTKYQDDIYNFSKMQVKELPQIEVEALDLYPNKDEG